MSISDGTDLQELTGCAHDICRCTLMGAQLGASYCSTYCENADTDGIEGEACGCGHPPCDER
jgi:hypothetical protein